MFTMNKTISRVTGFYEEAIEVLCQRAKSGVSGYREGDRDENGTPYGVSPWALAAKQLFKMQSDDCTPITVEEAMDPNRVFKAFNEAYELITDKKTGDFISDYRLRAVA